MSLSACPCCSGKPFAQCCQPFLEGEKKPRTPKQLMRSRYTAYCLGGYGEYLHSTWHPSYRAGLTAGSLSGKTRDWESLEVLQASQEGNKAGVEFRAKYREPNGEMMYHHEVSVFLRVKGQWYYTDGRVQVTAA